MIEVRPRAADGSEDAALAQLMYEAIHQGRSLYSAAERQAWMPAPHSGPDWAARLQAQAVMVAHEGAGPLGFMSLKEDYIDLAFVAPAAQGKGLFRRLFAPLEGAAREVGIARLTTHASLMAQPAFRAMGFHVIRHERIAQRGQRLARAEMEKLLP